MTPGMTNGNYTDYNNFTDICNEEKNRFLECMKKPNGTEEQRNAKEAICKKQLSAFYGCIRGVSFKHIR